MALWKEVKGYETLYLVSDDGKVLSLPRIVTGNRGVYVREHCILKPGLRGKNGLLYQFVCLLKDGQVERKSVHRLVAEAFVNNPNPEIFNVVNHIDHNTQNNCAENLEWCDQQYNNEHGHNKAVQQFSLDGEKIAEYKSITYASEITGINRRSINNVLSGFAQTAGGYVWGYAIKEGDE